MVAAGDEAPDFDCEASTGRIHLKGLRGSSVVLYFYPAASTPGCTIESKRFRDLLPQLRSKGVQVVGVSTDTVQAQQKFASSCELPFPLVADHGKEIARRYGVLADSGRAKRTTFLIDPMGKVLEVVEGSPLDHTAAAERRFLAG